MPSPESPANGTTTESRDSRAGDVVVDAIAKETSALPFSKPACRHGRPPAPERRALAAGRLPPRGAAGARAAVRHGDAAARRVRGLRGRRERGRRLRWAHRRVVEHTSGTGARHKRPGRTVNPVAERLVNL